MSERSQAKIAGACSLAFVFLVGVVIVMAPPFPSSATSAADVVQYYSTYRLPFLVGNYLAMLSMIPGMVIGAYLIRQTKLREAQGGWLWLVMAMAAAAQNVIGGLVLIFYQAAAVVAAAGNAATGKALSDLSGIAFAMYFVPLCGSMLAVSVASLKVGILPRWIGWAGALTVAAMIYASLGAIFPEQPALAGGGIATWIGFGAFSMTSTLIGVWLIARGGQAAVPTR